MLGVTGVLGLVCQALFWLLELAFPTSSRSWVFQDTSHTSLVLVSGQTRDEQVTGQEEPTSSCPRGG